MAVRGDEVASSIESHIRESIGKMVEEIRSSIEDVRVAVDQQLKAALQSVQADVNSVSYLPHIQKAVSELEESLTAEAPPPPAPVVTADASRAKRAIQAVERGKSQVDILNAMLEQCLEFGSRAALLILRDKSFAGWKGSGFSTHGGSDEAIKRFNARSEEVPELDTLLREEKVVSFDGGDLAKRLGGSPAERALLVPMVIKDKISAAVYVDASGDDVTKLDPPSVEMLVFVTGLLIDTLAIRKKIPSPTLNDEAAAAETAPTPVPPPPPPPAIPHPEPPPSAETVSFSAAQIREMMATPAPPPPPPAPTPAAPPPEHAERTSTQYVPPAGVARTGAFGMAQTDEAKKQDEARRFARLLVSEIKLYNEAKVEQGRKNHDLYERLKEDIDRSRQMYDERIAEEVRKTSNYFYDELVRILADGNVDALGL